jgi:hypothetical protein
MDKLMLELHPIKGSLKEKGLYNATIATGRGDVVGLDEIVDFAFDRGYIYGIKREAAKSIVRGMLDSIVAGIKEDGRTRCIDDYLSFRLKVHGIFEDAHDEFDPERHSLSLAVAPLRELRPSFKGVEATNPNHKRQFRIYSVKAADIEDCKSRNVFWRHDIIVKGADFPLDDSLNVSVFARGVDINGKWIDCTPRILSRSDAELRLAWPDELADEKFSNGRMEITLSKIIDPTNLPDGMQRREIKAVISKDEPKK